jgi:hypothetical protein
MNIVLFRIEEELNNERLDSPDRLIYKLLESYIL